MSDYWSETKSLFENLLERPPLKEKYLKKPSPKYIFFLIINTLKITEFPLGLFTEEEQTLEYFLQNLNHKKLFFKKIKRINFFKICIRQQLVGLTILKLLKNIC